MNYSRLLGATSFTITVLLLVVSSVRAQSNPKGTSKPLQITDDRIPTVLISPRDAASLPIPLPETKSKKKFIAGPAPASISWSDRTALLRRSGVSMLPAKPPQTFRLSVRQPYIVGAGWLEFLKAYQTSPKDDYALFDLSETGDAFLWARLNLESSGRYLVDFNIRAFGMSTFNVWVGPHNIDFAASESTRRISVLVDSAGSGLTEITIGARQGYIFRSMEVTRIDEDRR